MREHEPRRLAQAQLDVTVVKARDLAAMDANGFSDPYCVLFWEGEEVAAPAHWGAAAPSGWSSPRGSRANGGRALRPNRGLLTVADAGKRLEESLSSAQDALERRKRVVHTTVPRASGA